MVGAKLYITSGDNAGIGRTISSVNVGTDTISFTSSFPESIAVGDTYAISPVPFSARCWPVQAEQVSRFNRWGVVGISVKARNLSGFTTNDNDFWRLSAYRNSATSLEDTDATADVDLNPADSVAAIAFDGVDIEPYIEQIAAGVKFELTDIELALSLSDSRRTSSS